MITQIQTFKVTIYVRDKGVFYEDVRAENHWDAVKAGMRAAKVNNNLSWLVDRVQRVEVMG